MTRAGDQEPGGRDAGGRAGAETPPAAPTPAPDTAPPPPAAAEALCADALPVLGAYAAILAQEGVTRGVIGAREVPRLWERHLLNCAAVAALLPGEGSVADLGSGGGLPGVVLAALRPDLAVTLVEPMARRTQFLEEVVASLGLGNATVVRGRAEEFHGKQAFDAVTSRALGPLPRVLEWSLPLVRPTGSVLAVKGARVGEEVAGTVPVQRRWGCTEPEILELAGDALATPTRVAVVAWKNPQRVTDPPRVPGRPGPSRRSGSGRKPTQRPGNGRR